MKTYEVKNSHEAYVENIDTKFGKLIEKAWGMLEEIDPYCEWDEQTVGTIIEALAKPEPKLAEIIGIEAAVTYGTNEAEEGKDWGYDW